MLNKVQHLLNVITRLSSIPDVNVKDLQSFYAGHCRRLENEVELPKRIFGPGTMCSYCGMMWDNVDRRVRIVSGKKPAKFIRKIIKGGKKMRKVKETLVKKGVKNSSNKLIIRCTFCSKDTEIKLNKPARQKPLNDKKGNDSNENQMISKRKKRTKDKTAGLILTPNLNKSQDLTEIRKPKSMNLNKLGAMIGRNLTPSKKSSLHSFITELSN